MVPPITSTNLRSVYGVSTFKSKHKVLKRLKSEFKTPILHGHQLWQSSLIVMDYLDNNPLTQDQHIMDIGCGWGLLGIYCAKKFRSRALLIDADKHVLPYIQSHEALNNVIVDFKQSKFSELTIEDFITRETIVGADICFWPKLVTQLKNVIDKAILAGVKRIVLGDPGRPTFMQLAKHCQIHHHCELLKWEITGKKISKGHLLIIEC